MGFLLMRTGYNSDARAMTSWIIDVTIDVIAFLSQFEIYFQHIHIATNKF